MKPIETKQEATTELCEAACDLADEMQKHISADAAPSLLFHALYDAVRKYRAIVGHRLAADVNRLEKVVPCICGTVFEISGKCQAKKHVRPSSR